jgi:hypothetical protein
MHPASARLPGFVEKRLSPAYASRSRPGAAAGTFCTRNALDFAHLEQCLRFSGLHSGKPIMLMPARALMTTKKSSSPRSHVKRGSPSCRSLCGILFRSMETPPCLDRRSLLCIAAFGSKRIGSHPIGPEGAVYGAAATNFRSGVGAIQAFCPDDL